MSSYIDAFAVYGGSDARLEWLRDGPVDGTLADNRATLLMPRDYLPRVTTRGDSSTAPTMDLMGSLVGNPTNAVVAGDVRANENIALTAVHTLFAREHNRIVSLLSRRLSEETKFQIARRVVGAEEQYVTYHEFLPALGVRLSRYRGYDPNVDASLSNEFATRNDEQIDDSLHSILFQIPKPGARGPSACGTPVVNPGCFSVVEDVGAVDIARGRDHGMPSYNSLRAHTVCRRSGRTWRSPASGPRHSRSPCCTARAARSTTRGSSTSRSSRTRSVTRSRPVRTAREDVVSATRRTTVAARLRAL